MFYLVLEERDSKLSYIQGSEENEEAIQKVYLHIFNKSIFDLVNQTCHKMEDIEPTQECLKNIIVTAEHAISQEEEPQLSEDVLLWVCLFIEEQIFD